MCSTLESLTFDKVAPQKCNEKLTIFICLSEKFECQYLDKANKISKSLCLDVIPNMHLGVNFVFLVFSGLIWDRSNSQAICRSSIKDS
jgi:hypothetical protein